MHEALDSISSMNKNNKAKQLNSLDTKNQYVLAAWITLDSQLV